MNFRFFINLPSPFNFLSTPTRPPPSFSDKSIPTADASRSTSIFSNINHLMRSLWSMIPVVSRPSPRLPPPPSPRPDSCCSTPLFRPYVAKVPWHGGARAFLSQLFPRYGHYCGPNWSSGKDGGLPLWDKRPIDWLDFCCYCHDIGYDTHNQAKLLKADLAFLECLERPRMATKGDARAALLYRSMCIAGLRNILIPYRMQLLRLQGRPSLMDLMNSLIGKNITCRQD